MGTKLNHFPTPGELKRRREQHLDDDTRDDLPLLPFDETMTSGIDDTVRTLSLGHKGPHWETNQLYLQAISQLRTELSEVKGELSRHATSINLKQSKAANAKALAEFTQKWDRKMDNLFKLVGLVGLVVSALIAYKGHL